MRLCNLDTKVWRFVEDQNRASTMKLTSSLDDQKTLEELLDDNKPPVPKQCQHLNYLQFTPFRYSARKATRFRRAGNTLGVFYSAADAETAASEMAFYRLLFFADAPSVQMPSDALRMSLFSTKVASESCLDLTDQDWDDERKYLEHPTAYEPAQAIADKARQNDVEVIIYNSARSFRGRNYAVLSCSAFPDTKILSQKSWNFYVRKDRVIAVEDRGRELEFLVKNFANDDRIVQAIASGVLQT